MAERGGKGARQRRRGGEASLRLFFAACSLTVVAACSPVTTHRVLSVFLDDLPEFPPKQQYCTEYAEKKAASTLQKKAEKSEEPGAAATESRHRPYAEKRCDNCHDKVKEGGLVLPKRELCFSCHTNLIRGIFVHGPVADGDCTACHLPHTSQYPALLKAGRNKICSTCHREERLASTLHDSVRAKELFCPDCHDPHSGAARYYLK